MEFKNYYTILDVSRDADAATIKRAYRTLARQYHPDVNGGDPTAAGKFKEISEAYAVLSDAEKRRTYDQLGANWQRPTGSTFNWSDWFGNAEEPQRRQTRTSTEEFAEKLRRNQAEREHEQRERAPEGEPGNSPFSEIFQQLFGNAGSETPRASSGRTKPFGRAEEQTLPIEITLEEAFWGTRRTLQQGNDRFEVSIPRGVSSGSKVRITGNTDLGPLTLIVTIKPHTQFQREGDDLHMHTAVDLYTALLGGEIQLPNIEGHLLLAIPPNTQNGRVFRLKAKGMPILKQPDQRGDLYATIDVELPVPLSEEERRRFAELRRLRSNNDLFI